MDKKLLLATSTANPSHLSAAHSTSSLLSTIQCTHKHTTPDHHNHIRLYYFTCPHHFPNIQSSPHRLITAITSPPTRRKKKRKKRKTSCHALATSHPRSVGPTKVQPSEDGSSRGAVTMREPQITRIETEKKASVKDQAELNGPEKNSDEKG